jgi:hypothetical protein
MTNTPRKTVTASTKAPRKRAVRPPVGYAVFAKCAEWQLTVYQSKFLTAAQQLSINGYKLSIAAVLNSARLKAEDCLTTSRRLPSSSNNPEDDSGIDSIFGSDSEIEPESEPEQEEENQPEPEPEPEPETMDLEQPPAVNLQLQHPDVIDLTESGDESSVTNVATYALAVFAETAPTRRHTSRISEAASSTVIAGLDNAPTDSDDTRSVEEDSSDLGSFVEQVEDTGNDTFRDTSFSSDPSSESDDSDHSAPCNAPKASSSDDSDHSGYVSESAYESTSSRPQPKLLAVPSALMNSTQPKKSVKSAWSDSESESESESGSEDQDQDQDSDEVEPGPRNIEQEFLQEASVALQVQQAVNTRDMELLKQADIVVPASSPSTPMRSARVPVNPEPESQDLLTEQSDADCNPTAEKHGNNILKTAVWRAVAQGGLLSRVVNVPVAEQVKRERSSEAEYQSFLKARDEEVQARKKARKEARSISYSISDSSSGDDEGEW